MATEAASPVRILLVGCNGRMGRTISTLSASGDPIRIVGGVDSNVSVLFDYPVFASFEACDVVPDVIIDFSNPTALPSLIDFAFHHSLPMVVATTGLEASHREALKVASDRIPVFVSANMSLGINLLLDLAAKAASVLYPEFDIELIEAHHNQKLDAPSGTALMIADRVNETLDGRLRYVYDRHSTRAKGEGNELGIHAIRGGSIVGEHTLLFAGPDEVVEIRHSAQSRDVFAHGAMKAARFLVGKTPGMYSMKDLIAAL
jgi:4-hydroxy-tetrahydrodipicolinate reductase